MTERELLRRAAELAADHLDTLETRPVYPRVSVDELTARIDVPLRDGPTDPAAVVEELAAALEPGVVASQSGRYFGFVVGSSLPSALAADVLVSAWDQNLGLLALGPSALVAENTAGVWVKDLLGIPESASFAFVTGCQTAHFTCLAAARQHVLAAAGWDVAERGLVGSPPLTVLVGAKRHSTIDRALRYLGIGRAQIHALDALPDGRLEPSALRAALVAVDGPTIVCAQAGEVNTGASTTSSRSPTRSRARARGCTSTARSGCGPPRARRSAISSPARSGPTRGRPTPTSGSTCRTTAASRSARTPTRTARR